MSLGDSFPKEFREQSAERELKVGAVIKCWDSDSDPPKEKRFIVVGITEDRIALGAVYINTNANYKVHYKEVFQKLQIELTHSDQEYIDHNCTVDCSKIKNMDLEEIKGLITNDPGVILGHLTDEHEKLIFPIICTAPTIPRKIKIRFGLI